MVLHRLISRNAARTIALIALLSAGVIIVSLIVKHPLMGSRGVITTPALQVVEALPINGNVEVTVRNNDSNPVVGEAGYRLVSEDDHVLYESASADFGPLSPGETTQLIFDLPATQPGNTTIQGWAREHIAYLDTLQPEGLSLRNSFSQNLAVDQAVLEVDAQGSHRLTVNFQLTNIGSQANQYRYTIGIRRIEAQKGTPAPPSVTQFSSFTEISLAASETQTIHFVESGLAISPGAYSVSVWVQERDESGTFVQQAQGTYTQDVIAS